MLRENTFQVNVPCGQRHYSEMEAHPTEKLMAAFGVEFCGDWTGGPTLARHTTMPSLISILQLHRALGMLSELTDGPVQDHSKSPLHRDAIVVANRSHMSVEVPMVYSRLFTP